jgi:hypothetical protein
MSWLDLVEEAGRSALGDLGTGAHKAGQLIDRSANFGKETAGDVQGHMAELFAGLPGESIIPGPGATDIANIYHNGYNGYTGGRAVWEEMQSHNPGYERALLDAGNPFDPINLALELTGGEGARALLSEKTAASAGLRASADSPMLARLAGGIGEAGGRGLQGTQYLLDVPGKIIGYPFGRAAAGIRKLGGPLFDLNKESLYQRGLNALQLAFSEKNAALKGIPRPLDAPNVNEIVPPWHALDARDQVLPHQMLTDQADAAWSRLKAKFSATKPSPDAVGIVAGQDVFPRGQVPALTEDDINDLAVVGAKQLTSEFDRLTSPRRATDAPFTWAGESQRNVRKAITDAYGEGVTPYIPAAYDAPAIQSLGLPLPDPVYRTEYGVEQGGAAINKGTYGSATDPGMREKAVSIGAGDIMNNRVGGDSALPFSMPDTPPGVRVPEGGRGQFYMETGAPHPDFQNLLESARKGPHNLQWGTQAPDGTFIPAKQAARMAIDRDFGLPLTDAEYERIWPKIVQHTANMYEQAAQEVTTNISAARKFRAEGFTREEINAAALRKDSAAARKFGVTSSGLSNNEIPDPTTTAAIFERDPSVIQDPESYRRNSYAGPDFRNATSLTLKGGGEVTRNPTGILLPNLTEIMRQISAGKDIELAGGKKASEWYAHGAEEIMGLFGPDRLDDATLFMDLIGMTSPQTTPEQNVREAITALVHFKSGDTEYLRRIGLTEEQIGQLGKVVSEQARYSFNGHLKGIRSAYERAASDVPVHDFGGPKTTSYAGSFQVHMWRNALSEKLADNPELRDKVLESFDRSVANFTVDRHDSRASGLGTVVGKGMDYMTGQYRGREAARALDMLPPDAQAARWYWAKGVQGTSTAFNDSVAEEISRQVRKLGAEGLPPGDKIDAVIKSTVDEMLSGNSAIGRLSGQRQDELAKGFTDNIVSRLKDETSGFDGGTFEITQPTPENPSGLQEWTDMPEHGYMVGVAGSNPIPMSKADASGKQFKAIISRFRKAFESEFGQDIKVGVYKFKDDNNVDKFSIDLSLYIPDEETAVKVGRAANQESIYRIHEDPNIPVAQDDHLLMLKNPAPHEIDRGITSVDYTPTGKPTIKTSEGLRNLLATLQHNAPSEEGVGILNSPLISDSWNPFTQFDRAIQRVNRSYLGRGAKSFQEDVAARKLAGAEKLPLDHPIQTHLTKNALDVSDSAKRTLLEEGFQTGKFEGRKFNDVHDELLSTYRRGQFALKDQGVRVDPAADIKTKTALTEDKDAKQLIKDAHDLRLDPSTTSPEDIAFAKMSHELRGDYGIKPEGKITKYDMIKRVWGEQALSSPRYHVSNLLSNWMQNILDGGSAKIPVNNMWNAVKAQGTRSAEGVLEGDQHLLAGTQDAMKWGFTDAPRAVNRTNTRQGIVEHDVSGSQIGKMAGKIFGPKFGKVVGKPFEASKNLGAGIEVGFRDSVWAEDFGARMEADAPRIQALIDEAGQKAGVIVDNVNLTTGHGLVGNEGVLSVPAFKRSLTNAGIGDGDAEHIVRTFLNIRRTNAEKAIELVNKRFFSYERTNLDEAISKVVPFHYWASRATKYYVQSAIQHPIFLVNYARLREGIDRMNQDPGGSAMSRGFVKMLGGPTGFTLLMNPDALFGVIKQLGLDSSYTPNGETELGHIIRMGKSHGIGLFPWVDAIFNYMGAYGDTYEPDPAGVRIKALVGAAVNEVAAYTGSPPPPAPYTGANARLRAWVSDLSSSLLPGWMAQPVGVKSSADGTLARATLDDVITSRITAENPGITNQQLLDILNNPQSPEYISAYKDAASAGLIAQLLNFTSPVNTKVKENSRDVTMRGLNAIRKEADQEGVPFSQVSPTTGDGSFAEEYKRQTGRNWRPSEYDSLKLKRDLETAPPAARSYIVQEHEYQSLGSPLAQELNSKWLDIRTGKYTPPGVTTNLSPDERSVVADAWVQQHDPTGEFRKLRRLQTAYRDTHPEFDEYKNWSAQMYNIQAAYSGLSVYRTQVMRTNPNAKAYFGQRIDQIMKSNPNATPDQLLALLDAVTISPSTWFAVTGRAKSEYDQAPQSTGGVQDLGTQFANDRAFQQVQQGATLNMPVPGSSQWVQALAQRMG